MPFHVPLSALRSLALMTAVSDEAVARIMAELGLTRRMAQDTAGDEIGLADYFRALELVSREIQDETCRLSQRSLMPGSTHFVWASAAGAPELRVAMKRVAQAYNMLHGGHYNQLREDADCITYIIDDRGFPYAHFEAEDYIHFFLECVLVFLHCTLMLLAGDELDGKLLKVWTRRPRPAGRSAQLDFLGPPIRWNARVYALVYDLSAASLPVADIVSGLPAENAVYRKIIDLIERRLHRRQAPRAISDMVREQFEVGARSQTEISRRLGMSVATLRRRLADEDMDFRRLKQDLLNDRAKTLLRQGCDLAEIAETLGYADFRSFGRAFKSCNGITPAQFRSKIGRSVSDDQSDPGADSIPKAQSA